MKTILTTQDIKHIFENMLKENTSKIELIQQPYEDSEVVDLFDYFNFEIYAWKNRLISSSEGDIEYNSWVSSLNYSMDKTYGLVEVMDQESTASQDIDNATKTIQVSFIVPTNKITNLENYLGQIRNTYLGKPEKIQNQNGTILTTYINMGILVYDDEPSLTPYGEVIMASLGFTLSYINESFNYADTKAEISLSGDDEYDEDGQIIGETKYLQMPLIKTTWQNIFVTDPVTTQMLPNLTGFLSKSISTVVTISFYDFNIKLTNEINELLWGISAYRINGILQEAKPTNIPVFIRITFNGSQYTFKLVITGMEKAISNGEQNITSLSVKTWGKII